MYDFEEEARLHHWIPGLILVWVAIADWLGINLFYVGLAQYAGTISGILAFLVFWRMDSQGVGIVERMSCIVAIAAQHFNAGNYEYLLPAFYKAAGQTRIGALFSQLDSRLWGGFVVAMTISLLVALLHISLGRRE